MSLSIRERNQRVERVQKILDDSRSHSCYDTDYGRDCFQCDSDDPDYWTYRIYGLAEVNHIVEILLGESALTEETDDDPHTSRCNINVLGYSPLDPSGGCTCAALAEEER